KLHDFWLIKDIDYKELIVNHNKTSNYYPGHCNLIKLFQEQVNLHHNKIAIRFLDQRITYGELDSISNQISNCLNHFLQENESLIDEKRIIAIFLDKEPITIASIIAIIKCGGCYFPIDSRLPILKIKMLIEDVKP